MMITQQLHIQEYSSSRIVSPMSGNSYPSSRYSQTRNRKLCSENFRNDQNFNLIQRQSQNISKNHICQELLDQVSDYPDQGQLWITQNKMTHLTVTLSSVLRLKTIYKSKLSYTQRYHKLISTSYLIFQDCPSEQPPQTSLSQFGT
ncbi:Hypothetical_protein [Hexamita inflata]|uniref:Hypothetical_protein n=1 Tax=Hexamita inflata TaxID=28002 RepID=A0AA86N8E4_9EUKA|nr:Hypothetical protein HINF_LOCUS2529 [Hexamita inflata]